MCKVNAGWVNVMFMYKNSTAPYVQKLHKCECGLKGLKKIITLKKRFWNVEIGFTYYTSINISKFI